MHSLRVCFTIILISLSHYLCWGTELAAATEILTIIVPSPPGSAPDLVARKLSKIISSELQVGVVIENISGASGEIATNKFLSSNSPNSLLLAQDTALIVNPIIYRHENVRMWEAAKPIAKIAKNEYFLLVNINNPASNITDFVMQNSSKEIRYGSGGIGSLSDLFFRRLYKTGQLNLSHIPYKSNGEAALGLSRGEVDIIASGTGALPLVQAGKLKIISALSDHQGQRFSYVQNISTIYPQLSTTPWFGLFANNKMSNEMTDKLVVVLKKILDTPAERENFLNSGLFVDYQTGPAFVEFLENQYILYSNLLKSIARN